MPEQVMLPEEAREKFAWYMRTIAEDLVAMGLSNQFPLWCVYDRPTDHPDGFLARLWLNEEPTQHTIAASEIEFLREGFERAGFVCLNRSPMDDPSIAEVWI